MTDNTKPQELPESVEELIELYAENFSWYCSTPDEEPGVVKARQGSDASRERLVAAILSYGKQREEAILQKCLDIVRRFHVDGSAGGPLVTHKIEEKIQDLLTPELPKPTLDSVIQQLEKANYLTVGTRVGIMVTAEQRNLLLEILNASPAPSTTQDQFDMATAAEMFTCRAVKYWSYPRIGRHFGVSKQRAHQRLVKYAKILGLELPRIWVVDRSAPPEVER